MTTKKQKSIQAQLKELQELVGWFEKDEEFDVEEGMRRVKEGAVLVQELKGRLKEVENEFREVKKELEDGQKG